ncbi:hypothetical protein KKHLCK_02895 [Candidatus Electrothrix laxa]
MKLSKEQLQQIIIILIIAGLFFFLGRCTKPGVEITTNASDVSNEISNSFGWGKAPGDIQVEAVDITRGVIKGNSFYKHPMPAVRLAIKNLGSENLSSFGIDYQFFDIDNNKKLGSYAIASGSVDANWTGRNYVFSLSPENWNDLVGNDPIDFHIVVVISIRTKDDDIEVYRTTFTPDELTSLSVI